MADLDTGGDMDVAIKKDDFVANDYRIIDKDLSTGALADFDPLGADFEILYVKVLVYDGSDDLLRVKVGTTSSPEIRLSKLLRPDTDILWEGKRTGRVYLSQNGAQALARFRALVGVRL